MKFFPGDKVTANSIFDYEMKDSKWWDEGKGKIMTIKENLTETTYKVEENKSWWSDIWLLKLTLEFFKKEEFEI